MTISSVNKSKVLEKVIEQLKHELEMHFEAAHSARDAATNEEAKAEHEYDTRGLEASYLAAGQALRAQELQQTIDKFQQLKLEDFDEDSEIGVTALVEVEDDLGQSHTYFILPKNGGQKIVMDSKTILTLSPDSPIGRGLIQKSSGDTFEVQLKGSKREFQIVDVV